jgi:hypothetical protein
MVIEPRFIGQLVPGAYGLPVGSRAGKCQRGKDIRDFSVVMSFFVHWSR